jgi:hypothetical protein
MTQRYYQSDKSPADSLLPDYYETLDALREIRTRIDKLAGYSAPWNDPLIEEERRLEKMLNNLQTAIDEAQKGI